MRYTRIVAAFIFTTSLLISLCFNSFAANDVDTLVCESGVGHFVGANSSLTRWIDYTPVVNNGVYTFSDIPNGMTSGNSELALESFTFLTYSYNTSVTLERGYIYTFNFKVTTNKVSSANAERTEFRFGMCENGFTNNLPLSSVTYTYSYGSAKVTYNCTAVVNVDSSIDFSGLTSNDAELYYYLQITAPWSSTFTLTASNMTKTKSLGEESYYQASVDAIENLPNTEYNFAMSKLPDADGTVEQIEGDIDDIVGELNVELTNMLGVFTGISGEEPLVYMPPMKVPILDLDLSDYMGNSIDAKHYFHPLALVESMDSSGQALYYIELARKFLAIVMVFTFCTVGIEKMIKIEWWF